MNNATGRKTWTRPEVTNVLPAKHAQVGADSMAVDQIFPASNGATVIIS